MASIFDSSDPQTVPTQQQPSWQSMSFFLELMSHRSYSSDPQTFPSHQQPFIQTTTFPTNVNPFPG